MDVVEELARARIGTTFNQYAAGPRAGLLRSRLVAYLVSRADARILLVGEAQLSRRPRVGDPVHLGRHHRKRAGRGDRDDRHRVLTELGSGRRPAQNVIDHPAPRGPMHADGGRGCVWLPFAGLAEGRIVIGVGRVAATALGVPYARHPSRGGATAFAAALAGLVRSVSRGRGLLHSAAGGHRDCRLSER
jgi:hypothetical protein